MPDISELLEAARKPKRDNLGGVDGYLARILCRKLPTDMVTAIGRISLGHNHGMVVRCIHTLAMYSSTCALPAQVSRPSSGKRLFRFILFECSEVEHASTVHPKNSDSY